MIAVAKKLTELIRTMFLVATPNPDKRIASGGEDHEFKIYSMQDLCLVSRWYAQTIKTAAGPVKS